MLFMTVVLSNLLIFIDGGQECLSAPVGGESLFLSLSNAGFC